MKFLDPKADIVFKKLFGTNEHKDLLISLINSVMNNGEGEKVVDVTINDPANIPASPTEKLSIVDIKCTDQKGYQYIMEIQVAAQEEYAARAQYYAALGLSKQLNSGDHYKKLLPVVFIGILDFNLFSTQGYLSRYCLINPETGLNELKHLRFYFIELKKFHKDIESVDSIVDKWIYLLKYAQGLRTIPETFTEPAIKSAFFALEQGSWTPQELDAYERHIDSIRLYAGGIETAQNWERRRIAKELLNILDFESISRITGLNIEEIKKMRK